MTHSLTSQSPILRVAMRFLDFHIFSSFTAFFALWGPSRLLLGSESGTQKWPESLGPD